MSFFDLPTELRLNIYSELLVLAEPIVFETCGRPLSPSLWRSEGDRLCTELLRVNKKVLSEARPLLYARNCFQFPNVPTRTAVGSVHIAPFLEQIGDEQASLIRHICIIFPDIYYDIYGSVALHPAHIRSLALVREICTSLSTLELSLDTSDCLADYVSESDATEKTLDFLNMRFSAILSLKEVVVNVQIYGEEELHNTAMTKMCEYGWTVHVTKCEILEEEPWLGYDDDDYDNDWAYMAYMDYLDQERERQEYLEEYDRRRADPYWKNDSDYD